LTTLLLVFDHGAVPTAAEVVARVSQLETSALPERAIVEIPVRYDGEDLERVAAQHGLSTDEVVRLHAAPLYRVVLLGFSPGFPYLSGLTEKLWTPRLATPRLRVAGGAVAIGGQHTGIYPIPGPGGWNVIGHTSVTLFDPSQEGAAMFRLHPGDRVRFVPQS
jgi:KipI family sensor histidine kinase inhibitor